MPIYQYECIDCLVEEERLLPMGAAPPTCPNCEQKMEKLMTSPAFWKMRGQGGYPSRRKFTGGTAPGTTRATKVWGDYDPAEPVDYMGQGQKKKE